MLMEAIYMFCKGLNQAAPWSAVKYQLIDERKHLIFLLLKDLSKNTFNKFVMVKNFHMYFILFKEESSYRNDKEDEIKEDLQWPYLYQNSLFSKLVISNLMIFFNLKNNWSLIKKLVHQFSNWVSQGIYYI